MNKLFAIIIVFLLSACQSEKVCYDRLKNNTNDINARSYITLIYVNEDMSVCDYTVIGGSVVRR